MYIVVQLIKYTVFAFLLIIALIQVIAPATFIRMDKRFFSIWPWHDDDPEPAPLETLGVRIFGIFSIVAYLYLFQCLMNCDVD